MFFFKWKVKFILKIGAILLIAFFLGLTLGNNAPDEIKPGDGFSQESFQVSVEANAGGWRDSGVSISTLTAVLNFTITGSVFLCTGTDSPFEKKTFKISANNSNFVDTGMEIAEKEFVRFTLVPIEKDITNCGTVSTNKDFAFDENNTFQDKDNNNLKIADVCRGTDLYQSGDLVGTSQSLQGVKYLGFVDNTNTWNPESNKWLRSDSTGTPLSGTQWYAGSFIDLRLSEEKDNHPVSAFNCTDPDFSSSLFHRKIEAPIINNKCNKYARKGGSVFSYFADKDSSGRIVNESADGLMGMISTSSGAEFCFYGDKEISACTGTINYNSASSIDHDSVKLNIDYTTQDVSKKGKVFVGIGDEISRYPGNLGGYNIEIWHSCVKNEGENLYLYIGESVPSGLKPGDPDTIELIAIDGKYSLQNLTHKSGRLFFMIKDNMDGSGNIENYANNSGSYKIDFSINVTPTWISDAMNWIVDPLKKLIYRKTSVTTTDHFGNTTTTTITGGASYDFYRNLIDGGIKQIVRVLLVLFVVIIALGFLLGIVEMKVDQMFVILFKIGIVSILLTDNSWSILHKYFLDIFWEGPEYLISSFVDFYNQNSSYPYDVSFKFLDKTLGSLFAWQNFTRLLSLFFMGFTNPLAWALFIALCYAFWDIVAASFKGILVYCVCIIINGFLIGLAPIFICFILFKITFRLFDTWIKQLLGNMLTVAFYFMAIGMLNEILYNLLYQIFNFGVYKDCMLPFSIGGLKICLIQFPMPFASSVMTTLTSDTGSADAIAELLPINIPLVIVFVIFTKCFHIIIDIIDSLPTSIFGASFIFKPSSVTDTMVAGLKYATGQDERSKEARQKIVKDLKPSDGSEEKTNRSSPISDNSITAVTNPNATPPLTPKPDPSSVPSSETPKTSTPSSDTSPPTSTTGNNSTNSSTNNPTGT